MYPSIESAIARLNLIGTNRFEIDVVQEERFGAVPADRPRRQQTFWVHDQKDGHANHGYTLEEAVSKAISRASVEIPVEVLMTL